MLKFTPNMIIWSSQVSKTELKRVVDAEVLPKGTIIGLDRPFFEGHSLKIVDYCQQHGYPVFCDTEIIGSPDKCLKTAMHYVTYHPYMMTIMAGACNTGNFESESERTRDTLAQFAELCHQYGVKACISTMLTYKTSALAEREFGSNLVTQTLYYAELARQAGASDIICGATEAMNVRTADRTGLCLNVPGVDLYGRNSGNLPIVTTIGRAIRNGASRVILSDTLTAGEGSIEKRLSRNYAAVRKEIKDTLAEMDEKLYA